MDFTLRDQVAPWQAQERNWDLFFGYKAHYSPGVRVAAVVCHQRKIMTAPPFPLSGVSTLFLEPVTLILMSGKM